MEITLEKIELVKDRTGVSYKEAKEALEHADGSVVDAIIAIEETIDINSRSKLGEQGSAVIDKIKDAIRKGNVSKIMIKKDDEILLNLSVNIGLAGTILFPWAAIVGMLAAFGTKCSIELLKDDGEVVDLSAKANETLETVVEKGSNLADEMKEKSADVINNVKDKASEAMSRTKEADEFYSGDFDYENADGDDSTDEDGCCCVDDEDENL